MAAIVLSWDLSITIFDEMRIGDDVAIVGGEGTTSPSPAEDLVRSGTISAAERELHIRESKRTYTRRLFRKCIHAIQLSMYTFPT